MPASVDFDPVRMLEVLTRHRVDFVVIGGFAAWTLGVPALTADLDIIFDRSSDNIERLVDALRELSARYRDPMGRRIEPDAGRLSSLGGGGHHLFRTDAGDLDVLRESAGYDHGRLSPQAVELEIEGMRVAFAPLSLLIAMKEGANRPKDLAMLPLLRAALEDDG